MKKLSRRMMIIGIIIVVLAVSFAITTDRAYSSEPGESPDWTTLTEAGAAEATYHQGENIAALPPPPNQDPCLHCHILGEEKGIWTPLIRWVTFGSMGLIFLFGTVRSLSVWKSREQWKPISTRVWEWIDERFELKDPLSKFLNKPVPQWQRRWWYCLGGLTAFLFVVQGVTGTMLAFYYQPTPEGAYASIQFIETQVRFGAAIRAIHHWSANGMVLMVVAHMARVYVNGAFRKPRELNWVSGVILFITTMGFGLTGYLLPWDQRAYWATTVATEIAGGIPAIGELALVYMRVGWNITSLTLSRFYALHILILPALIVGMMLLHFIMVRKQGIHKPL